RQRFSADVAARIEDLAWWDWTPEKLARAIPDMQSLPIEAFLDRWENAAT
ncbi:MAG: antibiotic acetyltransferase, partial [Mesorhizobium sp.]